ncbi:D-alanyl-D-alanine carboxypeptidase/D-alanyl-D-alanine-endopeptidase (penicillin-binding protein 4) [Prauserella muralis]|nr:D-alanyl-D-alanine carboxypeptidase/D-alanyl-D-alanine-endopeptidase (penicillin-binding protein 4) [Prauserella muralis]
MRIEPDGRQHPAPVSTGSDTPPADPGGAAESGTSGDTGHAADTEPAPKRTRRRGLLLTGLALLLVIAAGVVLALPDVSNRLALPWAPNAPQGDPPEPIAVTTELHGPAESAPAPTPAGVAAALDGPASDPALGTLTGSVVDPATGTTLWARDESRTLTPASTTKLLVAGAALLKLDHGRQLTTKVVQGPEPGSVVLVAGGDVTLSSLPQGEESIYPGAAHLDDLVEQVRQATGGDVSSVQLDLSAFAGDTTAPGWAPGDAPSTFAAPVVPAMLDGGRSDPKDEHSMRVANPAGTLAQEFARRLGAQVAPQTTTTAPQNARVLGEVRSAPLAELVDQMLRSSDNLLGDVLARVVANAEGREPSFEGGAQATLDVLARNGFDVSDVRLSDGSGLSTLNKVPATMLSDLLASAAAPGDSDPNTAKLRPMLGGLPVAGGSGTLATRYTEPPATEGRGWVRAKTGTLSGVNTLAGVVLDTDGRVLVFTLMSAGADTGPARAALDDVAAQLRGCGCR